jgi:hypothetical protein
LELARLCIDSAGEMQRAFIILRLAGDLLRKTSMASRHEEIRQKENRLIQQVLKGCKTSFEELLLPNLKKLGRFVRAKMQNDHDADDIGQQTVLKAFTGVQRFRCEASFNTWLFRIAI